MLLVDFARVSLLKLEYKYEAKKVIIFRLGNAIEMSRDAGFLRYGDSVKSHFKHILTFPSLHNKKPHIFNRWKKPSIHGMTNLRMEASVEEQTEGRTKRKKDDRLMLKI